MHIDSVTETNHLSTSSSSSAVPLSDTQKSRYEDLVKVIFQQSHVQNVIQCLYIALMKLLDGKQSDQMVEWMHMMLTYGPFLTHRLLYPSLQGISWQVNDENGIQFIEKSELLPLRRDALITANMPYYLLDGSTELVLYQALLNKVVSEDAQDAFQLNGTSLELEGEDEKTELKNQKSQKQLQEVQDEKTKLFFIDSLITRLYEHPFVPRVLVSTAGTASSVYFTSHFATDNTSNHYLMSYEDFRTFILDILITSSTNVQK
jgi:hypothetical protein